MTCRYAHKRVALLLTAVHPNAVAGRVIEWPQRMKNMAERARANAGPKSSAEASYASK